MQTQFSPLSTASPQSPQELNETPHVPEAPRIPFPVSAPNHMGVGIAGKEFWSALLAAQSEAKELEHDGKVDKNAKEVMYTYSSATLFIREARRCLHKHDLVVVQAGAIAPATPKGTRNVLIATFLVVHAKSASGVMFEFDWAIHSTDKFQPPKATGAAYTQALRYFLRGLLLIGTSEDGAEDPERIYDQGRPAQWVPHPPPQGFGPPVPTPWGPATAPWSPGPFHQPLLPPQQLPQLPGPPQAPPPQFVSGPPQQHPIVHQAMQELDAQPLGAPPPQHFQTQQPPQFQAPAAPPQQQFVPPPPQPPPQQQPQQQPPRPQVGGRVPAGYLDEASGGVIADAKPGEPQESDAWVDVLQRQGWTRHQAEQFTLLPLDKPIPDTFREVVRAFINEYYGDNQAAAGAAWKEVGFTPRPELPDDQRPRPTGLQTIRYLAKMNWTAKRAGQLNNNPNPPK